MYGLVEALENGVRVDLMFSDTGHAGRFLRFMQLHRQEAAPLDGLGKYCICRESTVTAVECMVSTHKLDERIIWRMAADINRKRLAITFDQLRREAFYVPTVDHFGGCNRFHFEESLLPPRQLPAVGDMAMIVDMPEYDRVMVRVQEICNGQATVSVEGSPRARIERVPHINTMKIHDVVRSKW